VKGILVATAEREAYVQPGRAGMRWDACATEGLVRAAGGECTDAFGAPIDYRAPTLENDRGLVATNGHVHAEVLEALAELFRESEPAPRNGA
jgi:3'(2'), 5'-bisphosphate nucleotidase